MWKKLLIVIFFSYIFALLQYSFLTQFSLFGTVPNLVFILFFLVVFFEKEDIDYKIIIWSAIAGIFLDLFSYNYLGLSTVLFIVLGFVFKKIQMSLKNTEGKYPFFYFLPLFIIFLLITKYLILKSNFALLFLI